MRQTASAAGRRLQYAQVAPSASRVANRGVLAHSACARYLLTIYESRHRKHTCVGLSSGELVVMSSAE